MTIAITGATGFIGRRLTPALAGQGHQVRLPGRALNRAALEAASAVVHLAGEPLGQRWTRPARQRIRSSRIDHTRRLVDTLAALPRRPEVLVSASAIGIYGSRGEELLSEQSEPGHGFLAELCRDWEDEADRAAALGVRVVKLRAGLVLGRGGALARMLTPFRLGLGGPVGSGRQWMSWIHIDDLVRLIRLAVEAPSLAGAVNATAPHPVTNLEFARTLASVLHRPALFPVPAFALKLAFGEMAEVLLGSQRVLPHAAVAAGFRFEYPQLRPALENVLA